MQSPAPESVFAVIFAVVSVGAVALTLNVLLLVCCFRAPLYAPGTDYARTTASDTQGGRIIFFQSVAVLGYCLFPLDVRCLLAGL